MTIAAAGFLLAIVLGAWAGKTTGPVAGSLTAVAALVSSAFIAAAAERRSRNLARARKKQELLEMFAPPKPMDEEEDEG